MSSQDPDSRLLLLMRHGKAESGGGRPDQERQLADRGAAQARLVGEYLESQGVRPTRVLVSDSARTRGTWEALREAMPGFDGKVTFHEDIYTGGPVEVLDLLHELKSSCTVAMVIGHEPTMAMLVSHLADGDSDPGSAAQARIGMPTGAMGVLSGPLHKWKNLGEDSLTLHTIVRP
ncbi:SixA phosphatase family protein [Brachybacterium sp. DNPG3]